MEEAWGIQVAHKVEKSKFANAAIVGFDADGKLCSVALIMPDIGLTERQARREARGGGLAVKKVTGAEALELMVKHGWVKGDAG